ncbi:ankyrin repeat domain-containing protein [Candidatus Wolbachia massiliensis]|uniref:Ankyrin repeat domain-containing protein n=1 Tax=Candidatus Wolbachia massiliensis TaxID=1845000 RepID=A0A7M3U2X4_9RICK|nr:ankyrin repeat domain-containing protein [Candidatus Wolbachia massiliensis]QOD38759.1 ankyrin repeat domain-containing protein [Candidatus Wolbachia massiliensis]
MNREEALKMLGLNVNPSEREVKKAYRELILKFHPDKNSDKEQEELKEAEEKFKYVQAAYELLKETGAREAMILHDEDLDKVSCTEDLKFCLYMALFNQDTAFLKKLFSKFKSSKDEKFGDYINEMCVQDHLPLGAAINSYNIDLVKLLLENGANPNIKVFHKYTPLRYPGVVTCSNIVKLLLEYDADPNTRVYDFVPLDVAADDKFYEVAELLLKYRADPNAQDSFGNTTLHRAYKHYRVAELLLKHGADPNIQNILDSTPLHETMHCSEYECEKEKTVALFLKYGADPNAADPHAKDCYMRRFIERTPYFANGDIMSCIKMLVLPYGSNDKIKKLMAEYGGVDRRYLISQVGLACCCLIVASVTFFSIASPWCYIPTAIFALAACFFVKNAVQAAFFTETKKPSPEFAEVITKKVVNTELG